MQKPLYDVVLVGSGHNGLVAATLLARASLRVLVLEEKEIFGGATRTEYPFKKAPGVGTSTASYLLGLMPPEILQATGAQLKLIRRDPHYFLPTLDGRYLLFGSDKNAMREQFVRFFSESDWKANEALSVEVGKLRDDLGPSWMEEPLSLEQTAERYVRPELRNVFMDLVRNPVEDYLGRFGFKSELLIAMYAVTDGFSGLNASFGTPGTGMNFLVHNMCRLPQADGTWMIAQGGMGSIAREFARTAKEAGAEIQVGKKVERILTDGNQATGVLLANGQEISARVVLVNADPYKMQKMVGAEKLPDAYNAKLKNLQRDGTTFKVNMALSRLPTFKCLPENRGQHNGTIHLLPFGDDPINQIRKSFETVREGKLADTPTIEWYIHTQADPSLKDEKGNHNSALFVQWVPYELKGTTWEKEEARYVGRLFDIVEQYCPGFKSSVIDTFPMNPKTIEEHIGISYGHIHHIDNTFGFDQRIPYAQPIDGLYSCSAGCHPAGSVIGAAGYNSARRILRDLR
jgi:phytoene dehydrogenase-like protein